MSLALLIQYLLSGITSGSIYAIVAIGFNIIYNTTGIINFAQGEFVMLGAMSAISFSAWMPLPLAVASAVVVTAIIGGLIDIVFIRWLKKPTVLQMIMITIGLSILLKEAALHIWDEKVRSLPYFTGNECTSMAVIGAHISPQVLWVLGFSAVVVVLLTLFFNYTLLGRSMRACCANKTASMLCGINVKNMVTFSFMLSAGIGALAGCVISPLTQTHYECGTPLAIKGFTVAVLGGLGNSAAAVTAGLFLGIVEAISISLLPVSYKDVVAIGILLIILFFKPSGLFGNKEAGRLKEF